MLDRNVVAVFMEQVPDEIEALRDSIAKAETDHIGPRWERHRELQGRIKELKDRCEKTAHSLIIVLAGNVGTRRRLMRNRRDERRTCIMCGTEEVGTLATGFLSRFLFRTAKWKFERLNGYISRTFTDPQWYLETLSVIRNFSFSTDVVLQHAFPPQLPSSLLVGQGKTR
jgi:hypothetical protein